MIGNAIGRPPLSTNSEHAVHALGHSAVRGERAHDPQARSGQELPVPGAAAHHHRGPYRVAEFPHRAQREQRVAFSSIIALLAVGQFYVILTGGIDLSVGAILAMSTVIAALLLRTDMNAIFASLLTLAACGVVGLCNGLIVVWLGITPFIATLAMMSMIQGFSYIIQSSSLIGIDNDLFITMFSDGHIAGSCDAGRHFRRHHRDRVFLQPLHDFRTPALCDRRQPRGGAPFRPSSQPRSSW